MEDDTGGDPLKGCKWTHKTTAKVAEALKPAGIQVSANTVARLLIKMDYSDATKSISVTTRPGPIGTTRSRHEM